MGMRSGIWVIVGIYIILGHVAEPSECALFLALIVEVFVSILEQSAVPNTLGTFRGKR